MPPLAHAFLTEVPIFVLAAATLILAARHHSVATMLAALGFVSVVLSDTLRIFAILHMDGDLTGPPRFSWAWPMIRWGSILGLWIGSLCLLWHTLRAGIAASPNNRWRGP